MKLKSFILSLIAVVAINTLCYLPDHVVRAGSGELKPREPIFQSDEVTDVFGILGLDLRESESFDTANYIFVLNHKNKHTAVVSKHSTYMFLGINIYYAYYVTFDAEIWRMYQVETQDVDSVITQRFNQMLKEWLRYMDDGCKGIKKEII